MASEGIPASSIVGVYAILVKHVFRQTKLDKSVRTQCNFTIGSRPNAYFPVRACHAILAMLLL